MSCGDIIPSLSVTPIGDGLCRIESHYLHGSVIDEGGIIQSVAPGMDQSLVGLQARECARNPAVDYYRVDLRSEGGQWLPLSGLDVRTFSGELAGVTPTAGPRHGQRGSSDPVTLNAYADGPSLCLSTTQQGPIRQSLDRLVGAVHGESSYCQALFRNRPEQMCGILVPELQRIYNGHPERARDGLQAPQSLLDEHTGTIWGGLVSLLGAWVGLEGVAYMFGHRVHQWSARYARLAQRTATSALAPEAPLAAPRAMASGATSRSLLGRIVMGAANFLGRLGGLLSTPILVIDPCADQPERESGPAFCSPPTGEMI